MKKYLIAALLLLSACSDSPDRHILAGLTGGLIPACDGGKCPTSTNSGSGSDLAALALLNYSQNMYARAAQAQTQVAPPAVYCHGTNYGYTASWSCY